MVLKFNSCFLDLRPVSIRGPTDLCRFEKFVISLFYGIRTNDGSTMERVGGNLGEPGLGLGSKPDIAAMLWPKPPVKALGSLKELFAALLLWVKNGRSLASFEINR